MYFLAKEDEMSLIRCVAVASTVLFSIVVWAVDASACEAGFCVKSTVPADAAVDVPLDQKIFVYFDALPLTADPLELTLVEAETSQGLLTTFTLYSGPHPDIGVGTHAVVLEPLVPLAPDTEYEVVFGDDTVCGDPAFKFTTGTGDAPAPTFAGAAGVTAECFATPEESHECTNVTAWPRVVYTFDVDATDAAGFFVYRNDDPEPHALLAATQNHIGLQVSNVADEECFTLKAVSASGAEVGDAEVCVATPECDDPTGDDVGPGADVGPDADIGTEADTGATPTPDVGDGTLDSGIPVGELGGGEIGGGCNCATTPTGDASVLVLLLGLLGMRIRRRE